MHSQLNKPNNRFESDAVRLRRVSWHLVPRAAQPERYVALEVAVKYLATMFLCAVAGSAYAFFRSSAGFDRYPGTIEEVLKSVPERAAERSIAAGDRSLLMVPDCFMGMPGYTGTEPPKTAPKILGRSCEELFSGTEKDVEKLKEWARRYNLYMQQHNNQLNEDDSR